MGNRFLLIFVIFIEIIFAESLLMASDSTFTPDSSHSFEAMCGDSPDRWNTRLSIFETFEMIFLISNKLI